jgi:uncharacterized circularly permuted ATP-grasp superfamily protein
MDELGIRIKKSSISLRKTGLYNVYDAEKELVRPWKLDPIPFVLQSEWEIIEKDLFKRNLLDLIYKDIYGEQLLIKNNIIPAELVYNNSGF